MHQWNSTWSKLTWAYNHSGKALSQSQSGASWGKKRPLLSITIWYTACPFSSVSFLHASATIVDPESRKTDPIAADQIIDRQKAVITGHTRKTYSL